MRSQLPQHVGMILDGNRRWARKKGLPTIIGHQKGLDNVRKISRYCFDIGIKHLTIFAFSTENWNRSKTEINYLMKLFKKFIREETAELVQRRVRINFMGLRTKLDQELLALMRDAEEATRSFDKKYFNICLNYGGRVEIAEAVRAIIKDEVGSADVTPELISRYIWSKDQPDPDLIIRTSGEQRLSGFLTWQSVYSELYFSDKNFPSFTINDLKKALSAYTARKRRFGGG